jgi:uncharacterized protein (TIGR02996 family)
MLRRFERTGAFWEIDGRTRNEVVVRWGTQGRPLQSLRRTFATDIERARFIDGEVAKQVARGYAEVAGFAPEQSAQAVAARELALERVASFVGPDKHYAEIVQQGRSIMRRGAIRTPPLLAPTVREASALFEDLCRTLLSDPAWRRADDTPVEVAQKRAALVGNPELEALCLQSPEDPAPWAVYADWLIAHQDPRGEIAMLYAGGAREEAERLLRRDLDVLCPEPTGKYGFEFRHGFVVGATLKLGEEDGALDEMTRTFLASPLGRFVESLRFGLAGFSDRNDWAPTLRAVCESAQAPRIRELRFDAYIFEDSEISWTPFGDLGFAWPRLPALELLHIRSGKGGQLGELVLPRLRTFIRESGGLAVKEIATMCEARWPALEHLEIWTGSANYGATSTIADLHPILAAHGLPRLRHLGIVNSEYVEDAIEALAHSRVLPRLESLDLRKGILARRGVRALVANAPAFRHLAALDLRENLMTDEQCQQVRDALDNVIVTDQRDRQDYDEDEEEDGIDNFRYVALGE